MQILVIQQYFFYMKRGPGVVILKEKEFLWLIKILFEFVIITPFWLEKGKNSELKCLSV